MQDSYVYISRHMIHVALEHGGLCQLRDWILLRKYMHTRSGLFSLTEYINLYARVCNYSSLENKSHNHTNRKKFRNRKYKEFRNSPLFQHIKGDKFRFISEKKLLIDYKGNRTTTKFLITEQLMHSKKGFIDCCIGIYTCGTFRANQKVANDFQISKRRVIQATNSNNTIGVFEKTHRKVIEYFPSQQAAWEKYNEIVANQIFCEKPFKVNNDWALAVFTSNRYRSGVLKRKRGKTRMYGHAQQTVSGLQLTVKPGRESMKDKNIFQPAFRKGAARIKNGVETLLDAKILAFNKHQYNIDAYITDHSHWLTEDILGGWFVGA